MNELIQQLEYKGYQFDVTIDSEVAVNGADAFHQPLMTNRRYYEPLNSGMYEFGLKFIIATQDVSDYKQRKNLLLRLLREGKVGEMYHPYFGRMAVACDRSTIRITESASEIGICGISANFKEVTFKLPPEMVRLKPLPQKLVLTELVEATKQKNSRLQALLGSAKTWYAARYLAVDAKLRMLKTLLNPIMSKLSAAQAVVRFIGDSIDRVAGSISRQVTNLIRYSAKATGSIQAIKAQAMSIRVALMTGVKTLSNIGLLVKKSNDSSFSAPTSVPANYGSKLPEASYVMLSNEHIDNQTKLIDASIAVIKQESNELGAIQRQELSTYLATKRLGDIVAETIKISNSLEPKEIDVLPNQDLSNDIATRIIQLESEFLNAYIALNFVDTVASTEFTTLNDVIETLDTLYKVVELLDTFKELPDEVVAKFKAYIYSTATDIYNNIDEVQTITNVDTRNLPLRVLSYRLYGSTEFVPTLQELNGDWFDLGESPNKIKILE